MIGNLQAGVFQQIGRGPDRFCDAAQLRQRIADLFKLQRGGFRHLDGAGGAFLAVEQQRSGVQRLRDLFRAADRVASGGQLCLLPDAKIGVG